MVREVPKGLFLCVVIISLIVCSCRDENALEMKRQLAIEQVSQTYLRSTNPVPKQWGLDIITALEALDVKALKVPMLVSAVITGGMNNEYNLYVFWIEDKPSITGIELSYGVDSETKVVPLSDDDLRESRRAGDTTILLGASYQWEHGAEMNNFLSKGVESGKLNVRVMRKQIPASNWLPVKAKNCKNSRQAEGVAHRQRGQKGSQKGSGL